MIDQLVANVGAQVNGFALVRRRKTFADRITPMHLTDLRIVPLLSSSADRRIRPSKPLLESSGTHTSRQCTCVSKDRINAVRELAPLLTFGFQCVAAGGSDLV